MFFYHVHPIAKALEDLMTLYFSHPSIEGIILWGFWDGRIWKENATLVEGDNLTVCQNVHVRGLSQNAV